MTYDEFHAKFWELWYRGQTEAEKATKWLPAKRPTQTPLEYIQYLWTVSCIKCPAVVEIGVKDGHQRRFYEELLDCDVYVGVDVADMPGVDVVGNSTDPETVREIMSLLPDEGADVIFIDGNHSAGGVRADWETYRGLVVADGFLAFHDTHHDHAEYCAGAAKLWPELQRFYARTWDIYHEWDGMTWAHKHPGVRKQCGIGLVQVP